MLLAEVDVCRCSFFRCLCTFELSCVFVACMYCDDPDILSV